MNILMWAWPVKDPRNTDPMGTVITHMGQTQGGWAKLFPRIQVRGFMND